MANPNPVPPPVLWLGWHLFIRGRSFFLRGRAAVLEVVLPPLAAAYAAFVVMVVVARRRPVPLVFTARTRVGSVYYSHSLRDCVVEKDLPKRRRAPRWWIEVAS